MKKELDLKNTYSPKSSETAKQAKVNSTSDAETDSIAQIDKQPAPKNNSRSDTNPDIPKTKPSGKVVPLRADQVNTAGDSPAKKRFMLVMMFFLAGVLIIVLSKSFGINFMSDPAKPNSSQVAAGTTPDQPAALSFWKIPEQVSGYVRDVTGIERTYSKDNKILVKGILCSNKANAAIVGNEVVRVGDRVYGMRVLEINTNEVVFEKDGKKWSQGVE